MSITHSLLKLPDKQNCVTQNAENCTVLLHFVPYGTKISAHTETSISVVNGHFDRAENLTFCTAFTTAKLKPAHDEIFTPFVQKFAMSITHSLLKLPDKQNCVTQNAENCTVLLHFVPYGTKISAPNQTCNLQIKFLKFTAFACNA